MISISASLASFIAAASLLTIAPGLDTALVLRTAARGGPRPAALTSLGIAVGCFSWATLVAVGLGALLAASQVAYTTLRWIGAAYLVYIGYKMLRNPRRSFLPEARQTDGGQRAFSTGLLTNLLNPKVGVFYVSFLPQFVPAHVPTAPFIFLLAVIHALTGALWFACLILATQPLKRWLQHTAVVRWIDRVTGAVFLGFGARLAFDRH